MSVRAHALVSKSQLRALDCGAMERAFLITRMNTVARERRNSFVVINGGRYDGRDRSGTSPRARDESLHNVTTLGGTCCGEPARKRRDAFRRLEKVAVQAAAFVLCSIVWLFLMGFIGEHVKPEYVFGDASDVPTRSICAQEGDSLWLIAQRHPIEGVATTDTVRWLREINGLESSTVLVGQRLLVNDVDARR